MGYKRAGFYGYDLIENLGSQSGIKSAEGIIPEFQAY
jgi:methyl coenzyme M reductase alpha subunit